MLGLRSLANSLKATRLPQRVNVVRAVPRPCVLFSQTRGIAFRASPFSRNQYTLPDGTVVPAYVKPPRSPYTLAGLVGFVVGAGLVLLFRTEDEKEDNQLAEEYVSILRKFNRDESLTPEDVNIVQSIQVLHNDVPSVKTLILAAKVLIEAEERGFDVRITKRIADNLLNWTGKDEEEEIALRLLRLAYGRRCYSRAELVNDIEYLVGKIDSLDPKDLTVVGFAMLALGKNKQAHDVLSKAAHPVAKFVSKDDSFENLPSITFTEAPFPVALERSFNFATLTLPGKLYKGVAARDWAVLYNAADHSLLRIKAAEFNSNEWVGAVSDKDGNTIPVRLGGAVSQG